MALIHTCAKCNRKISDENLKHISGQGYFCPFPDCGAKKDGRTWKKRQAVNFSDMPEEKETRICEKMKQSIMARQTARRQTEGLIF